MRWGILTNLAIILLISGFLLFAVFSASLERSALDLRIQQADIILDLLQNDLFTTGSPDKMWERVRKICRTQPMFRFLLYDEAARVVGGCNAKKDTSYPITFDQERRIKLIGPVWPANLFTGSSLVADSTSNLAHDVKGLRVVQEIPASIYTPAWKFFAVYLILTQSTLFFLGYVLFQRTILGPIKELGDLVSKGAGLAVTTFFTTTIKSRDDVHAITANIKSLLWKILDDKNKMSGLVAELTTAKESLEAAQKGLIQSEKLAGIGRLASGIAHEIGNPLQIILGYVELLERKADSSSKDMLHRIEQELKRIHSILQRLLDYARPERKRIIVSDINEIVRESILLVSGRKGFSHINFDLQLQPLPAVKTEPEKLKQILINILFNAADAITTDQSNICVTTCKRDGYIILTVTDTGCGILEENLQRIYDPFFTTKEPGKGTGLGLAVCLGLITSMEGQIHIDSKLNCGTTVSLSIPAHVNDDIKLNA